MPRKERKLRATKITPIKPEPGPPQAGETINVEEANNFQQLCLYVSDVLRTDRGKILNCRLKVLVENQSAIVYQGLLGNVWGRLKADGRHQIYRHALKNVLADDPRTKSIVA